MENVPCMACIEKHVFNSLSTYSFEENLIFCRFVYQDILSTPETKLFLLFLFLSPFKSVVKALKIQKIPECTKVPKSLQI